MNHPSDSFTEEEHDDLLTGPCKCDGIKQVILDTADVPDDGDIVVDAPEGQVLLDVIPEGFYRDVLCPHCRAAAESAHGVRLHTEGMRMETYLRYRKD